MIYLVKAKVTSKEFSSFIPEFIMIYSSKISKITGSKLNKYLFKCSPDTEIKIFSPSDEGVLQDSLKLAR